MADTPGDAWASEAAGWDTDPAVVAYADAAFASLREAVALSPTTRVLDFGCGTGLLTERLAPHVAKVVAVDASPAMIAVLKAKGLPTVRAGVARWSPDMLGSEPLVDDPFDLIVCSSVLAFVDDHPATVATLASLLAPGGHLVHWDWAFDPQADEPFGLTPEAIDAALRGASLDVVSVGVGFDVPMGEQRMRPLMGVGRKPSG